MMALAIETPIIDSQLLGLNLASRQKQHGVTEKK